MRIADTAHPIITGSLILYRSYAEKIIGFCHIQKTYKNKTSGLQASYFCIELWFLKTIGYHLNDFIPHSGSKHQLDAVLLVDLTGTGIIVDSRDVRLRVCRL